MDKSFSLPKYYVFPDQLPEDKYSQQFKRFIKAVKNYLAYISQKGNIDLEYVNNKVQECYKLLEKESMHGQKFSKKWSALEQYANKKIKVEDIEILLKLGIPQGWKNKLIWYILTGEIKFIYGPSNRCYVKGVDKERGEIILGVSADATFRDMKRLWESHGIKDEEYPAETKKQLSNIEELQKDLPGNQLKVKHIINEKKLLEQISIAKDREKYRNKNRKPKREYDYHTGKKEYIGINSQKADDRIRLVGKYNPGAVEDAEKQKREEARQRQAHRRHKNRI